MKYSYIDHLKFVYLNFKLEKIHYFLWFLPIILSLYFAKCLKFEKDLTEPITIVCFTVFMFFLTTFCSYFDRGNK